MWDYVVIGSGFGGSVSALRLAEKGYRVLVLEAGRRYRDQDFAKTRKDVGKWLYAPKMGLHGIMRLKFFRHAFFLAGAGVGGGSLVYGNTLLVPPDRFFMDPQWKDLADWKTRLQAHYATAQRMLGVTPSKRLGEADKALRNLAEEMGRGHTFHHTNVGVFFGEEGKTVKDPYFGGEGPERTGCNFCGACMTGCPNGAKNTLVKNYLYLAEKNGAQVQAETRVVDVVELEDGSYELTARCGEGFLRRGKEVKFRSKGVVFSAGVLGTVDLLCRLKDRGSLPRLSDQLGQRVRTNSEAIMGVAVKDDRDQSKGIAIASGFYPRDDTHVEICRYGENRDTIGLLSTLMVGGGPAPIRVVKWAWQVLNHPVHFFRCIRIQGWAKRNIVLLVMQNLDNHMSFTYRRPWYWPFKKKLMTRVLPGQEVPVFLPVANMVAEKMAEKMNGYPVGSAAEVLLNKSTTAHILGGAVIAKNSSCGVINARNEVFGYKNMYVVDGSMIPANLGVNPSLTITAMAEHAMSLIPKKGEEPDEEHTGLESIERAFVG